MIGVPEKPGWVVPSIVVACRIGGNAVVGLIVCTPVPGIAKVMRFGPGVELFWVMAYRSEPGLVSSRVLSTVKVASSNRSSKTSA